MRSNDESWGHQMAAIWNNAFVSRSVDWRSAMRKFVRRFRHGRSSVQLPDEAVVETSEQAPGDTEQSALPDSVDDAAWTEELDFGDVEGAYLAAVHSATAPGRGRTRGRKLRRIRILGLLDAGTWAWIGTDDTWGVLSVDSEPCGQWDVQAGDTITAMVESQPWQHQLESVAPPTLQRVQHATAAADPEPVAARIGQASPAAAHAVGWKAKLKPGDVVHGAATMRLSAASTRPPRRGT